MIKYVSEFIGTFVFLSIILNAVSKNANNSMTHFAPLAIGLGLVAMIEFGGGVSGGHYNPAVSLMFMLNGGLPSGDIVPYVSAQLLGAVAAYYYFNLANRKQ